MMEGIVAQGGGVNRLGRGLTWWGGTGVTWCLIRYQESNWEAAPHAHLP